MKRYSDALFPLAERLGRPVIMLSLLFIQDANAQELYQTALKGLADQLRERVTEHSATNILVSPMKRLDGLSCELGKTLTLDLEAALSHGVRSYRLLDRLNLEALESEHRLEMEGWMDEEQRMREAGKLLKAEVMVFGYYTFTGDLLMLRVKAVDIQTSEQLVVLSAPSRPDAMIRSICDQGIAYEGSHALPVITTQMEDLQATPVSRYSDPAPVGDAECVVKRFGSYCFRNEGTKDLRVLSRFPSPLGGTQQSSLFILPGRTECFYSKPAGSYEFTIHEMQEPADPSVPGKRERLVAQGSLQIDPCGIGQLVHPPVRN